MQHSVVYVWYVRVICMSDHCISHVPLSEVRPCDIHAFLRRPGTPQAGFPAAAPMAIGRVAPTGVGSKQPVLSFGRWESGSAVNQWRATMK